MNAFPLSPFLALLITEGFKVTIRDYERISIVLSSNGPWNVKRLRGVLIALLVHNPDQEIVFSRLFDGFFRLHLESEALFHQIDLELVIKDLRSLAGLPNTSDKRKLLPNRRISESQPKSPRKRANPLHRFLNLPWLILFGIFTLSLLGLLIYQRRTEPLLPQTNAKKTNAPNNAADTNNSIWDNIIDTGTTYWKESALALVFVANMGFIGWAVWRALKSPKHTELFWDPSGPRYFPLGLIGGKPAPRLDQTNSDYIADSLGYFQSEQADRILDVIASVEATGKNFGFPTLVYRRRKLLRTVLILEDAFAEALAWNTISQELSTQLSQRGIPVLYGKFYGSLAQFRTSDGMVYSLEDLEDERRGYLLLIFSDGKSLHHYRDKFALESIARWPQVAWLELREGSFWDESSALPLRYGIPLYPATPEGLLKVINRYMKEEGSQTDFSYDPEWWKGSPAYVGGSLDIYLEYLLGDALLWAQDCAVLQPVSFGLADSLRRQFHSLPPERIDRLLALPGTTRSVTGIRFSSQVLAILRSGFSVRRSKKEQEEIVRFILKKIEEIKPEQIDSLAYLAWEWTHARVRLNVEPTIALKRLKELTETPLGDSILDDLKAIVIPEFKDRGSIWELENSYRIAHDLFKKGELDSALQIVIEGLNGKLNNEALLLLRERIEKTKEIQSYPGNVSFFEQKQRSFWDFIPARSTYRVNAKYPLLAKQNSVSGMVVIELKINDTGEVIQVKSLEGPNLLRDAAESASKKWKFDPAIKDGSPTPSVQLIVFNFHL